MVACDWFAAEKYGGGNISPLLVEESLEAEVRLDMFSSGKAEIFIIFWKVVRASFFFGDERES